MVEVLTVEDFNEFRKSIEEKFDAIEQKLDAIIKNVEEKRTTTKAELEEINQQIEVLSQSSKGFVERLREALRPNSTNSSKTPTNSIEDTEKTIGKVAEVTQRCSNFFNWDWCQENCPLYFLCDDIAVIQDISKLQQERSIGRIKGFIKRLETTFNFNREEEIKRRSGEAFNK